MDAPGDGADFDAAAGSADVGAEGVLVLIFDDDGEIGTDLARDGFGGEMEAGVPGNGDFNAAGSGFEVPIAIAGGITGDFNAAGGGVGFDVVAGTSDGDRAACGVGFDAPAGGFDIDGAGDGANAKVTFDRVDLDAAGGAGDARVVAEVADMDGAAGRFDLHAAIHVFDGDFSGSGVDRNRTANVLNILRAAGDADGEFGFLRDFDGVGNGRVAEAAEVFTDADQAGALFNGRIVYDPFQFILCAAEKGAGADFGMDVDFAVGGARDADGARAVREFEAQGAGDGESAIERALFCWAKAASGERGGCREKGRQVDYASSHSSSSARIRALGCYE